MNKFSINKGWINSNVDVKIGPDEVRYQARKSDERESKSILSGKLCDLGLDYITLQLANGKSVTILMNRIKRILWTDPNCKSNCQNDHHVILCCDFRIELKLARLRNHLQTVLLQNLNCYIKLEIT